VNIWAELFCLVLMLLLFRVVDIFAALDPARLRVVKMNGAGNLHVHAVELLLLLHWTCYNLAHTRLKPRAADTQRLDWALVGARREA